MEEEEEQEHDEEPEAVGGGGFVVWKREGVGSLKEALPEPA